MAAPAAIGLDIGSTSIRAVEVKRTKARPMLERFAHVPLHPGTVVGGVVKDEKAVTAALRELRASTKFRSKSVTLAVTHQQVVVREVEVSNLPAAELRRALPHQVRDVLPLPVDDAILDFYPLEEPAKTADTVRGLLLAAPREAVTHTVEAVEKAGMHVDRVDLSCFAVLRAIAGATDGAGEAIIDIGANNTLFVLHVDGVPHVVRTIPRGGQEITGLLSRRLHLSEADAEQLKCVPDAAQPHPDRSATVADALRPFVAEIRSSISYFLNGDSGNKVSRVTLVGGGSRLRGLGDELSKALSIPVVLGNPLQYVGYARQSGVHDTLANHRAAAAVAVGLTLGGAA